MPIEIDKITVVNNSDDNRFEVREGEHLAVIDYYREGNNIVFTHTGVPTSVPVFLALSTDAMISFVSVDTIARCYASAGETGSGIPVMEMDESVRMLQSSNESVHMDRLKLRRIQTPQVFKSEMIKEAYRKPFDPAFTDDASVFESQYENVTLVEGNSENIKITTPTDMQLASVLIGKKE